MALQLLFSLRLMLGSLPLSLSHARTHARVYTHTHTRYPHSFHNFLLDSKYLNLILLLWKLASELISAHKNVIFLSPAMSLHTHANCAPVFMCLRPPRAPWHMIQPYKPFLLPTSSNAPFEVELDKACCIKLTKSSVCFLQGHSTYYKDKNRAL